MFKFLLTAVLAENYFKEEHSGLKEGEYDLFETFEGYIWDRFNHLDSKHRQFYLHQQAAKEFGLLRNIMLLILNPF